MIVKTRSMSSSVVAARKNILGKHKQCSKKCNTYRRHIRQSDTQQIDVVGYTRTHGKGDFKLMAFLQYGKIRKC